MGNKVSTTTKKKEKDEKIKEKKKEIKQPIEKNEQKNKIEETKNKYILLSLFSNDKKEILIQNFLLLSNVNLSNHSKDDSLTNEAIKGKILEEGEIEEETFIKYLDLPPELEKFKKILYNSLKNIKYIKKKVNLYEQESDIQKYLNQYEGKNVLNFEQYLFAIALYCMKFDEETLSNEQRERCIFNSFKEEITKNEKENENENKTPGNSTSSLSNELDALLGIENPSNALKISFETIETIVMGMAWIAKIHYTTINKIKEKINIIEEEKMKEKEEEKRKELEKNKEKNKEKIDKELIEKMNKQWKEHLNKEMPVEVAKSLSDLELSKTNENKSNASEINKKKEFFDYRSIDNYDINVEIDVKEITVEKKYIKNALITALPQKIRKQSSEEQSKYLITWKEWNKWRSVRAPNIFRILAVYINNTFFNLVNTKKPSYYLLKNGIKDYGIMANMDDLSRVNENGYINWELLYIFSWFMPNNSMGSNINMDILYQASIDGFSINRFEKHVRLYPGSTVIFISGDLISDSSNKEPQPQQQQQQILVGAYVQTPWKLSSSFWSNNQCIIFEMYPNFESCPGTRTNNNYVLCNMKNGIGFGGKIDNHRLWINNLLQKGGYQYDILVNELNTYKPSDNNFIQNFEVNDIFVVGLGGREALDAQKKAWEFEKNESERRVNVNIRQANGTVDKQFLQMVGIIDQSAEDRGIERYIDQEEKEEH